MRGRICPKAWVFPVPERVCSKVLSASSKSLASRAGTRKSRHASKNLPAFRRESLSGDGARPTQPVERCWRCAGYGFARWSDNPRSDVAFLPKVRGSALLEFARDEQGRL